MPDYTIRRACAKDRQDFVDLSRAFTQFQARSFGIPERLPEITAPRQQQSSARLDSQDASHPIWLAHQDDRAIGYLIAEVYEPEAASENEVGPTGFIDELFVVAEQRGGGVATALMQTAVEWLRVQAVSRVVLHVYSRNENALHLYERMGFSVFALSLERQL